MECQASAVRCGSDRLHCLFVGATESVVRLPVGRQITGWGPEETLRCSAKKSVAVVEACQDQRPHQGVRGLNDERPTVRPELADVKVTRPHQPCDVLGETNGGVNIRSEIANRLRWLYNFSADGDWIEGTSCQTTCRTQSSMDWASGGCLTSNGLWSRCSE